MKRITRRRKNCGEGSEFPVGQMVPVSGVRMNADGTITVLVDDKDLAPAIASAQNPRRRRTVANKKKKAPKGMKYDKGMKRWYKDYGLQRQYMPKGWKPKK